MRPYDLMMRGLRAAPVSTYSYWNPVDKGANASLADSNRVVNGAGTGTNYVRSLTAKNSGKWRVQLVTLSSPSNGSTAFGISTSGSLGSFLGGTSNAWALWGNYTGSVRLYNNGSFTSYAIGDLATNDRIDMLIDIDSGKVWFAVNGAVISGDPAAGTGAMASFTAGASIYIAADPYVTGQSTLLRTNPSEIVGSGWAGFTNGWPD